jgi:hypothetical protein
MGARLKNIIVEIYLLAAAQARVGAGDVILGRVCVLLIVRQFETMGFIIDFYVKLCRWSARSLALVYCVYFSPLRAWSSLYYFVCRITKLQTGANVLFRRLLPHSFLFYLHRVRAPAALDST